ncbi:MAG: NADH:ubiquinone reductase (Na(+)-transporting) subunit C [Bacteroidales bacterium]|nr:NADH:ubiquinone reductase (Na(+)-transporting) subunit C [Bacteroidales bacterium]
MNTNSNVYTVVYSAVIVVIVAAILAFAAQALKPKQDANIKADTISQMLTAAQFASKEDLAKIGNDAVLAEYSKYIKEAFTVNAQGQKVRDLDLASREIADNLHAQNTNLKKGNDLELPVYIFDQNGKPVTVVPVYGAGLWGPVWGYIAFKDDLKTVAGAYFDHDSETPGLGAKIKDDPEFRAKFVGKIAAWGSDKVLSIIKGASQNNEVDAITGATMTSKGLSGAIETWLNAYKPYFSANAITKNKCNCGEFCPCGEACECDCHCTPGQTQCNCPDCPCENCPTGSHKMEE